MNSTSQKDICIKALEPVNITLFGKKKKKVFSRVILSLRVFRGKENSALSQVGPKCCSKYPYKADNPEEETQREGKIKRQKQVLM